MKKLILFIPIILTLIGCPQKETPKSTKELPNKWNLVKLSTINSTFNEASAYINFSNDGKGNASVGCNTIGFNFTLEKENKVKIGNIYSTRMYCSDLAKAEKSLTELLKQIHSYKIEDNHLFLLGENDIFIECDL